MSRTDIVLEAYFDSSRSQSVRAALSAEAWSCTAIFGLISRVEDAGPWATLTVAGALGSIGLTMAWATKVDETRALRGAAVESMINGG